MNICIVARHNRPTVNSSHKSMSAHFKPFSLNVGGRIVEFDRPTVMGVINVTPDSFFAPSRAIGASTDSADHMAEKAARMAEKMAAQGAGIIDIGGCSTRPGAEPIDVDEEIRRTVSAVKSVREAVGREVILSIDTFRAEVARRAVEAGADIVNDISGGIDAEMIATVAQLRVPYVLTHNNPAATTCDILADVIRDLHNGLQKLVSAGVSDVIVDPGIGFGKTVGQNYVLIEHLDSLSVLNRPVLVGVSRKSMITSALGISADEALNATTALHAVALDRGAAILRVHDVGQAVETVKINRLLSQN